MIRKLKWKFVCINMLTVSALLLTVCLSVLLTSRQSLRRESMEVLERVITMDIAPTLSSGDGSVQLPYFTIRIFSGTAYLSGGSYYEFESQQELQDILNACLAEGSESGVLEQYGLRYLRDANLFGEKIAFVDTSFETATLRSLTLAMLLLALPALAVLFALSLFLASRAVRPVEQTLQQQRQFLSDASHELKTPLTVILSNVELLESELPTGENLRWLGNIEAESQKMRALVEELLTLERSETMDAPVFAPVSLSEITLSEVLRFEPLAFEAGKPIEDNLQEDLILQGEEQQLHRLMSVLLDNAIRHGTEGEPIRVSLRQDGSRALLTVSNAAEHMDNEELSRLFQRFYRADSARSEGGFGLGLPIARAIARQHGGELTAEYSDERLCFTAALPVK